MYENFSIKEKMLIAAILNNYSLLLIIKSH